jgi:hypothetical protein
LYRSFMSVSRWVISPAITPHKKAAVRGSQFGLTRKISVAREV